MNNCPILQYNGDTHRNTAFLSEQTQRAIYDACEYAEKLGLVFNYEIRNDYNTAGIFAYTANGETKQLRYSPITQTQEAFINEVKSALFELVKKLEKSETPKKALTREFYMNRKLDLLTTLATFAENAKLNEARVTYGRICELIDLAYFYKVISTEEYHADNKEAQDCFYDNL